MSDNEFTAQSESACTVQSGASMDTGLKSDMELAPKSKTAVNPLQDLNSASQEFLESLFQTSGDEADDMSEPVVDDGGSTLPTLAEATFHDWVHASRTNSTNSSGVGSPHVVVDVPASYAYPPPAYIPQGYHHQNAVQWGPIPPPPRPQATTLSSETIELLKTAIASDLQVKLAIQLGHAQQSIINDEREELRKMLIEIKDDVRTLKRRKRS